MKQSDIDFFRRQREPAKHLGVLAFVILMHVAIAYGLLKVDRRDRILPIREPLQVRIIEEPALLPTEPPVPLPLPAGPTESFAGLTGLAGPLFILLAVQIAKNGKFEIDRLNAPRDEVLRQKEISDSVLDDLRVCETNLGEALGALETADSSNADAWAMLQNAIKEAEDTTAAIAGRLSILQKQHNETMLSTLIGAPVAAVAGSMVLGEGIMTPVHATSAVAPLFGIVSGVVCTLLGVYRTLDAVKRYRKSAAIDPKAVREDFCADSAFGLTILEHLAHEKHSAAFQATNWLAYTASNLLVTSSALLGPLAPIPAAIGGVGATVTWGMAAILPRRQWRGRTLRNGENTTHINGTYLNNNRRRNRLVHHLNGKLLVQQGEVEKMIDAIGPARYGVGSLNEQLRYRYEQLRQLRWMNPSADRKILTREIFQHFEETKEHQSNFMLRTTNHEENHWIFVAGQLEGDVRAQQNLIAALEHAGVVLPDDSPQRSKLQELEQALSDAKARATSLGQLRQRLQAFVVYHGLKWSEETIAEFRKLQLQYMDAHDLLTDAMPRDEVKGLLREDRDKEQHLEINRIEKKRYLGLGKLSQKIQGVWIAGKAHQTPAIDFLYARLGS